MADLRGTLPVEVILDPNGTPLDISAYVASVNNAATGQEVDSSTLNTLIDQAEKGSIKLSLTLDVKWPKQAGALFDRLITETKLRGDTIVRVLFDKDSAVDADNRYHWFHITFTGFDFGMQRNQTVGWNRTYHVNTWEWGTTTDGTGNTTF